MISPKGGFFYIVTERIEDLNYTNFAFPPTYEYQSPPIIDNNCQGTENSKNTRDVIAPPRREMWIADFKRVGGRANDEACHASPSHNTNLNTHFLITHICMYVTERWFSWMPKRLCVWRTFQELASDPLLFAIWALSVHIHMYVFCILIAGFGKTFTVQAPPRTISHTMAADACSLTEIMLYQWLVKHNLNSS
jgi:hypothetical protein